MCILWGGTKTLPPSPHYCFLTAPPLSLHPLPSLINCSNLPFGTQGRGHKKAFVPWSPTGSCLVSVPGWMRHSPVPKYLVVGGDDQQIKEALLDSLIHQRADSRSKKNCNPAACGTKTTFTERQTKWKGRGLCTRWRNKVKPQKNN